VRDQDALKAEQSEELLQVREEITASLEQIEDLKRELEWNYR
jgi:hypothetical protein